MIQPSLEQLKELAQDIVARKGSENSFVVQDTVLANDLNPHVAYLKLARPASPEAKPSFLLESAIAGEQIDRYSFLGTNPRKIIYTGANYPEGAVDPLTVLETELNKYNMAQQQASGPFMGGAVGYVGYDCIKYFEPKSARPLKDTLGIPEAGLMLFDTVVTFDNVYQRINIMHTIHVPEETSLEAFDFEAAYKQAQTAIQDVIDRLQGPAYEMPQGKVVPNDTYEENCDRARYESHVHVLQENIHKGNIFQGVPSRRLRHPTDLEAFNIYRHLRTVNPSPYMFYVDFLDFALVGASPEVLAKLENGRVISHPIAGTVPRGKTVEEDTKLAEGLLENVKDRAEHVMLVDLARNDINRVCKPQSSRVDKFMTLQRFSHVTHIVSECSGELRDGLTRFDAFRSIFPCGTVSGAPKVRAMQLIGELEKEVRGPYAGAVGSWGYDKNQMNTCIALRTMLYKDRAVYLQAGGGIVFDSDPYEEYIETVNKLKSNTACLAQAEQIWAEKTKDL